MTTMPDYVAEGLDLRRLIVTRASEITPRPVAWTWQDRAPQGMTTLLAGREGTGKSSLLVDTIARLTRGQLAARGGTPNGVRREPRGMPIGEWCGVAA